MLLPGLGAEAREGDSRLGGQGGSEPGALGPSRGSGRQLTGEANPEAQDLAPQNEGLPPSGGFLGSESGTWGPTKDRITSQMGNVPEPEKGPTGQAVLYTWEVLSMGLLGVSPSLPGAAKQCYQSRPLCEGLSTQC